MRVSMSPSGSVTVIEFSSNLAGSPARLHHSRDQALRRELPERDPRHAELAVVAAGPPRHLAAVPNAVSRRVARQLRQLELGGEPFFHAELLIAGNGFEPGPLASIFLGQPPPPVVGLDRALLRHSCLAFPIAPSRRLALRSLAPEREVEAFEQSPRLLVVPRRGADDHIEAPDPLDLVVVDLRE